MCIARLKIIMNKEHALTDSLWLQQVKLYYDYVRDIYVKKWGAQTQQASAEGHYEFMIENDMPFWEPASVEEELMRQLQDFTISPDGLS